MLSLATQPTGIQTIVSSNLRSLLRSTNFRTVLLVRSVQAILVAVTTERPRYALDFIRALKLSRSTGEFRASFRIITGNNCAVAILLIRTLETIQVAIAKVLFVFTPHSCAIKLSRRTFVVTMRLIRFIATIVHPITDILKVQTQSVGAGKLFTVHFALVRFVGGVVRTTVEILVAHPHDRNALLGDGALEEVIVADHLRVII